MERYITFSAAKSLDEVIEHEGSEEVHETHRHRGVGSLFGWIGRHLHRPHH